MLRNLLISPFLFTLLAAEAPFGAPAPIAGQHGTELRLFAREPFLRNTVAVAVGEDGKVYATSVLRRKAADLDIRQFRDWVEKDLSLRTVEEKRAFLRSELVPENGDRYRRIGDQNKDGIIDWQDLTVLTDRILVLEDTDGDGLADRSETFAEGFNTEVTGIAAGLEVWDGNVFATVEPDVLRFRNTDDTAIAEEREVLATGFSVRLSYAGHNFSGPVVGPDGRLYVSSADKGMHVTTKEGRTISHPLSGTIARCELDGSNFEVFCHGLRNAQEIAFDQLGNLFGVDNDGDHKGEKERLVYLTQGSDHGWRYHWQYRSGKYQPWMTEGLSRPEHPGRPAFSTPALHLYHDGPAGFAFNPGTALNEHYHDHFFMTGFPARKLYAFQLKPKGAAFEIKGDHVAASGVLMVGLDFGPDGALYLADWSANGYELNEKGGLWTFDDPRAKNSQLRRTTAALLKLDHRTLPLEKLSENLAHPDQRVRMKSQFALVEKGEGDFLLTIASDRQLSQLARIHAIWGLGQHLRLHHKLWDKKFHQLYRDPDSEIRAQAARVAGDSGHAELIDATPLLPLLSDPADRPRFFAALALGSLGHPKAFAPLVSYLEKNGNEPFHRHAGIMGLAGCATPDQLTSLASHPSLSVRLAAVVALRRLRLAEVAIYLNDSDPLVVTEAARAIYDDEGIPGAYPSLAALIGKGRDLNEPTLRRVLGASLRLRTPEQATAVARVAADEKIVVPLRLAALDILKQWPAPEKLDPVQGRYQQLPAIPAATIAPALQDFLPALFQSDHEELTQKAREAAAVYGVGASPEELPALVRADDPVKSPAALHLLAKFPDLQKKSALESLNSKHPSIRGAALEALAKLDPENFARHASTVWATSKAIHDRRVALEGLTSETGPKGELLLRQALRSNDLPPELSLDLYEAIRNFDGLSLQQELRDILNKLPDPILAPYKGTLEGGNPARGKNLFNNHLAAQCVRCHAIGPGGSAVGPNLSLIGKLDPTYLLAALVDPGRDIAPGFGFTTLTLKDETSVSGILEKEDLTRVEIRLTDGKLRQIDRTLIKSQAPSVSSMPPMGQILTKKELRDLLAYLQSLK